MFACFLVYGTLMPGLHGAGNWFDHTRYWWEYSRSNACFPIKYEDLVEDPVRSLSGFAKELGFGDSDLERAVTLANQDTRIDGQFFWKQRVNHHLEMLPAALIEKWYGMYGDEMKAFGYPPPHSMRPASADREPN
jgi:hypothetical protein